LIRTHAAFASDRFKDAFEDNEPGFDATMNETSGMRARSDVTLRPTLCLDVVVVALRPAASKERIAKKCY